MLSRCLCLLAIFALSTAVHAQVDVQVLLPQKQFLAKETMEIGVRVLNRSGQDLNLRDGGWLEIVVMDSDQFLVKQIGPVPVAEDLTIQSSYMGTQWLDIGQSFDFKENQRYSVKARVTIRNWNRKYSSPEKDFEVIRGISIWQEKFGVPTKNPGEEPEFRTYILQQAIYLENPQMYLRVYDDTRQSVISVKRLAPLIQISRPTTQIDTMSRLHVFAQVSVKDFAHIIVNPDGDIVQRQTYVAQGVRPALKVSRSGSIYIAGGVRELRKTDIPMPKAFLPRAEVDVPSVDGAGISLPEAASEPTVDPIEKASEELEKRTVESTDSQESSSSD